MRDRLIEIISEYMNLEAMFLGATEKFADHLLANGVIVPPCKVGQTVYRIVEMSTGVKKNSTYTIKRFIRTVEVTKNNFFDVCENWGKTVFLTAEEAEKALKERSENGK